MRRFAFLCCIALFLIVVPVYAQSPDWIETLGGEPCPNDSDFTCMTITVPLDHFDETNPATIEVAFAVLPASVESQGLFVIATGGPGSAGIGVADDYTSYFYEAVLENFDIVYYDQRGIGLSGGLDCPNAITAYTLSDARPFTPEGEAATIAAAQTFAQDCQTEMGSPELLSYISTEQAVRDLEVFRQLAGYDSMWLYGESYGTQYAQTYAAAFPDVIDGLILDGVVDLTLEGQDFYVEQAQAFNDTLTAALEACNDDAVCASDMGGDAVAFYDDLAAELLASPAAVEFPLADGSIEIRAYTFSMLELSAYGSVYGRGARSDFLRLLAAAARGDLLPLMRDFYINAAVDPFTFEPVIDPTYFTSMFYAVECGDYNYFSGSPDERAAAFIESGNAVDKSVPRLAYIYYTDLPCVFWDSATPPVERPASLSGGDYTTFILNTSTDPATPTNNGYDVFDRLIADGREAYMITQEGGPHVIYGREDACPDEALTAWMVDGVLPTSREYVCPGSVIDEYTPLNPTRIEDYASPLDAIQAVDLEIQLLPEYLNWYVDDDIEIGCPFGGSALLSPTDEGELFVLTDCAFVEGFALTGTVTYDWDIARTFEVVVNDSEEDYIIYTDDLASGMYAIEGTFGGETLATPRLFY